MELLAFQSLKESSIITQVSVHPSDLGDVSTAILKELNKRILVWDSTLNGMMVSFTNIKLKHSGRGDLHDENPYVHFTVQFNAQYFSPQVGSFLIGRLCGVSEGDIKLMIMGMINARIPVSALHPEQYTIREYLEGQDEEDEPCYQLIYEPKNEEVAEEEIIHFQIEKIVVDLAGFPTIIGSMLDKHHTGVVRYLKTKALIAQN